MSLRACIRSAQAQGHISLEEALALEQRYDRLARTIRSRGEAQQQLLAEMEAELVERRRRNLLAEMRRGEIEMQLLSHREPNGTIDPAAGLMWLLEHHGQARFDDVEHRRLAILGQAHARLEELLHAARKGAFTGDKRRGFGETAARMDAIVREAFGEASGDPAAAAIARAWGDVTEQMRMRFNEAGGAIGRLERWGLPQLHRAELMIEAGFDQWRATIEPLLDPARMRHPLTGGPMTAEDLAESLRVVYDRVTTDGWLERQPSGQPVGAGALFRQHSDHRFLVFRNADGWLAYQRQFGEGDSFAAMMGHVNTMARDIAAMEILGPNPEATLTWAKQLAMQHAMATGSSRDAVQSTLHRVDQMWAHIRSAANTPVNSRWANILSATRNVIGAAALGSASVTAITDQGTQVAARMFVGMPAAGQLMEFVRSFGREARREAVRAGLILDAAQNVLQAQTRYVGSISTRQITGYIADRVHTFSGLTPMTQAAKYAFGMDFQAWMADSVGQAFGDLPGAMQRMLDRHGFSALDWDLIRAARLYQPQRGATFLRPQEIEAVAGRELAERYLAMLYRERTHAVIEGTVRSRSLFIGENQPGTLVGELVRSASMLKSFPATFTMMHVGRVFREVAGGAPARGAIYGGGLLIATTLLGAAAMQLKELIGGRDPRPAMKPDKHSIKFWAAAMLQGGGLGIYGDFLFSDVNRFGGGLAGTVAGPLVDRLDTLRRLTIGNAIQFAQGEQRTNAGREMVNFLRQNTPGGSLWWARLTWERIFLDQLQHLVDPDAHGAFRRREQQRRREIGNEFWWRPGETAPDRGPAFVAP